MEFNQRVYVQYEPCYPKKLVELQNQIIKQNGSEAIRVPQVELHMTVIHFGIVEFVYNHLKKAVVVETDQFNQELSKLIENYKSLTMPNLELEVRGLILLGAKKSVIALDLEPNNELEDLHAQAYAMTVKFFINFGLRRDAAVEFMKRDRNLKFAHQLMPHVSLVKRSTMPNMTNIINDVKVLKLKKSKI